ncbi:hypothetical protein RF11_00971 [Thelohanellus kitauei]|uniref:Uncharacterized protein n=1 Tax=Thelohanellus kitauei TaxID=669202 RepID=A0A0C2MQ12_THEKT|nr:hypothetical protein RF11_00971 [Thelohanellus kitauei]
MSADNNNLDPSCSKIIMKTIPDLQELACHILVKQIFKPNSLGQIKVDLTSSDFVSSRKPHITVFIRLDVIRTLGTKITIIGLRWVQDDCQSTTRITSSALEAQLNYSS